MYCTSCGTEITINGTFCPSCGAKLKVPNQSQAQVTDETSGAAYETPVQYASSHDSNHNAMTYEQYVNFHKEREARDYLANAEERVASLTKRITWCATIGAMFAVMFIVSSIGAGGYGHAFAAAGADPVFIAFLTIMTAAYVFVLPFGFVPVIDFIRRNGFFVWGWVMIALLFVLVVMFAAFACIPYAIYIFRELKKTKAECESLRANFASAAA